MHGPGIAVKLKFEAPFSQEFAKTLLSAATEGTFLLLLAERMFYISRGAIKRLADRRPKVEDDGNTTKKFAKFKIKCKALFSGPSILYFFFLILSIMLAVWSFTFTMSSITSDAAFRDASGDSDIDADTLREGFRNPMPQVHARFIENPFETVWRIVSSSVCLGGSIWFCAWNRRRESLRPCWDYTTLETEVNSIETGVGITNLISDEYSSSSLQSRTIHSWLLVLALLSALLALNSATWYTPVIFAYISVYIDGAFASNLDFQNLLGKPSGNLNVDLSRAPNVIFIQHESLSGGLMLNTEEGRGAMPFFQKMMHTSPNFYVFEHARTISGLTKDALPALMTGCAPTTEASQEWVQTPGRSLAYDFSAAGYATASFSSRFIDGDIKGGAWSMLYDVIVGGVEHLVDPESYGMTRDLPWAADDRKLVPHFFDWLATVDGKRPFYAQFYNFNQHTPYLVDPEGIKPKHDGSNYFDSLMLMDDFLRSIMEPLQEMGILENTIIVGSGDHGEEPKFYARLNGLTSIVAQPASYIYYRKDIMPDPSIADRLRRNTQKLISTLDFHPTIKSIVQGGAYDYLSPMHPECITGVDLTAVDIPDDRVTLSWNYVSSKLERGKMKPQFWAIHTTVASTAYAGSGDVTLYHRLSKNPDHLLCQGANNTYILIYGDCVASWTSAMKKTPRCMTEVNDDHKAIFRRAIQWIKHSPIIKTRVGESELVRFFADVVGWEENGEVPVIYSAGGP
jgi:hypothetical protein